MAPSFVGTDEYRHLADRLGLTEWNPVVWIGRLFALDNDYAEHWFDYTKMHGYSPAEADLQRYFKVSPRVVHDMILMLEKRGLIERSPRQSRSIRVLLPPQELPALE